MITNDYKPFLNSQRFIYSNGLAPEKFHDLPFLHLYYVFCSTRTEELNEVIVRFQIMTVNAAAFQPLADRADLTEREDLRCRDEILVTVSEERKLCQPVFGNTEMLGETT